MQYVLHRIVSCDLIPVGRVVSYIMLINWDSARQMVSLELSHFIWMEHSSEILNIKVMTVFPGWQKIICFLKYLTPKVNLAFKPVGLKHS